MKKALIWICTSDRRLAYCFFLFAIFWAALFLMESHSELLLLLAGMIGTLVFIVLAVFLLYMERKEKNVH